MDFEEYEKSRISIYSEFANVTASILESAVRAHTPKLRLQQVQSRAKDPSSLKLKLIDRGISLTGDIEDEIKDLAGCRLIFYSNSDVGAFEQSGIIYGNFEINLDKTKIHQPIPGQSEPGNLFISQNYVLKLKEDRIGLPEYKRFSGLWCEVQLQTILNHAWSETAHDITYKRPKLEGFGTKAFEEIDTRLQGIMNDHLLPAGYEFQKVLDDFEKLKSGKQIYDLGGLSIATTCRDNNDLYDLLKRFEDYVLPRYDAYEEAYPGIAKNVVWSVKKAFRRDTVQIVTPVGNFSGHEHEQIVQLAVGILTELRYVDVERTFDSLCSIFSVCQKDSERKHVLSAVERLAQYNMQAWELVGPQIQSLLLEKIRRLPKEKKISCRSLILAGIRECLGTEVSGTTSTYNTLTLHRGTVVASEVLKATRRMAVNLLKSLYKSETAATGKHEILSALLKATNFAGDNCDDALNLCIVEDSIGVVSFLTQNASEFSFQEAQWLEYRLHMLYDRINEVEEGAPEELVQAKQRLVGKILKFRDFLNGKRNYVIYKTLVGFETVLLSIWEEGPFSDRVDQVRDECFSNYIKSINSKNLPRWVRILRMCGATVTNDGATFLSLDRFLAQLGEKKAEISLHLLDLLEDSLDRLKLPLMQGISRTSMRAKLNTKIGQWVGKGRSLELVALYFSSTPHPNVRDLAMIVAIGIERADKNIVARVIDAVTHQYVIRPSKQLIAIFMRAVSFFDSEDERGWINYVWPLNERSSLIAHLSQQQTRKLLRSLVPLRAIGHRAERLLHVVASKYPQDVVDFLGDRLRFELGPGKSKDYRAIPYSLHTLSKNLVAIPEYIIKAGLEWFNRDQSLFEFRGARFIAEVFPELTSALSKQLSSLISTGDRRNLQFVLRVLKAYRGKSAVHKLCQDIVQKLPQDDDLLVEVSIAIDSNEIVGGEFGLVQAYIKKKELMAAWLKDRRKKVRLYAEQHIKSLERTIAREQARSQGELEARKLAFGT